MAQSNAIATGQVSITASAILVPGRGDRKKVTIINGAVAAAIGPLGVAIGTGVLLAANATLVLETAAPIYAVSGGTSPISYIEEFA